MDGRIWTNLDMSKPQLHLATLLVLIPRTGFSSDAAFCSAAQIDPSLFIKIKKGTRRATSDAISKMASALDVPITVLTRGVELEDPQYPSITTTRSSK